MMYQTWSRYENPERWTSYYCQINELMRFAPTTCLEIGVGNNIVADVLKRQGLALTTLDIDARFSPDIVGSVEHIPVADASYDAVLCAEVLEHLPFASFEMCIAELARVSRKGVVLSLPHWGYTFRLILDIPGLPSVRFVWKLPFSTEIAPGGVHFWEIGRTGFPLRRIIGVLEKYFVIEKDWLSPWNSYHHFFRLKKKDA